jgi:hypothetical protein
VLGLVSDITRKSRTPEFLPLGTSSVQKLLSQGQMSLSAASLRIIHYMCHPSPPQPLVLNDVLQYLQILLFPQTHQRRDKAL